VCALLRFHHFRNWTDRMPFAHFFCKAAPMTPTANRKVPPIISQCGISMLPKLLAHGERHPSKKGLTDLFVLLLCVTKSLPKFLMAQPQPDY
jgi:hypothetical protein